MSQSTTFTVLSGNSDLSSLQFQTPSSIAALLKVTYCYDPGEVDILGDRVWNDANGNGIQDPDEAGIEGAEVVLTTDAGDELGRKRAARSRLPLALAVIFFATGSALRDLAQGVW